MNQLLNYDNKFFQGINKIADCFILSVLWLVTCIPVFTIGASCTAAYYTVHKVLRGKRGYVWRSFFDSFKSNFKQSTIIWLICLAAGILLGFDAYITYQMLKNGEMIGTLYYVFLFMMGMLIVWMVYLFSYVARFENSTKDTMKNAAIIAIANLPKSLLILVIVAACFLAVYVFPFILTLMPALLCWALNLVLEKIYIKYMSPEDVEREKELMMEIDR